MRSFGLATGPLRSSLAMPQQASGGAARVVLLDPRFASEDPELEDITIRSPSVIAWGRVMSGRPLGSELRRRMHNAPSRSLGAKACAIVASAAFDADQADALRAQLLRSTGGEPGALDASMALAALSTTGAPEPARAPTGNTATSSNAVEPASSVVEWQVRLRARLREIGVSHRGSPSLLAHIGAALLVADARDSMGQAMSELVLGGLEGDQSVVDSRSQPDAPATMALAIAQQKLGRGQRARALAKSALETDPSFMRRSERGAFWWLLAAHSGVLGSADSVSIEMAGQREVVDLTNGPQALSLSLDGEGSASVVTRPPSGGGVLVRLEAAYAAPFEAEEGSVSDLSIDGDPGSLRHSAGYTLSLSPREAGQTVVEVQLPAGAFMPSHWLRSPPEGVRSAEARSPGYLRLVLFTESPGETLQIPLPLRFAAFGTSQGLAAVAYRPERADLITVLEPRQIEVPPDLASASGAARP